MQYYHYTNAQALHSIIVNRKLWLTDLRFMNDSSELSDGIRYLREALDAPPSSSMEDTSYLEQAVEFLQYELSSFERNIGFEDPLFALSLSSSDDVLSQWRAYGDYSIRFEDQWLEDEGLTVSRCIYKPAEKTESARRAVNTAIEIVALDLKEQSGGLGIAMMDAVLGLIDHAATFKNEGFQEEGEGRIIVKSESHRVQYRPRGSLLIPYVEVDIPLDAISGVTIGPIKDAQLSVGSMRMFAQSIEAAHASNGGSTEYDLEIRSSVIPYRP